MEKGYTRAGFVMAACLFASVSVQAQGVYAKAGFLGVGVGYAYSLNERFTVRSDVTTIGSYRLNRTIDNVNYKFKLKSDQAGVYGDWFAFSNGFRISAGLHLRNLKVDANARPTGAGTVEINNTTITYGATDALIGRVKFPTVAPYLGIGWGHHETQAPGFGFVFDLGVSYGKPKTSLNINSSLMTKLVAANLGNVAAAQAELAAERRELAREADKFKFFPQLYVGVSYRF